MRLTVDEFRRRYPEVNGKLYGGHCTLPEKMRQMYNVVTNMHKCKRDWAMEKENCDFYIAMSCRRRNH